MIKALIFDFDGVILESVDVKGWAFQKIFEDHPKAQERILAYHYDHGGLPRSNKIRYILKEILKLPYDDAIVARYCERFGDLVFKRVVDSPFVPGAREALEVFRGRFLTFVVSGTPHEEINRVVDAKGLRSFFSAVYGSPVSKDERTGMILAEGGLAPQEVLWIGDATSDLRAATKYGICFVLRSWPGNEGVFRDSRIDFRMDDLTGLPSLIEQLQEKK